MLASLAWQPRTVIVCENLQCAYSFGDIPDAERQVLDGLRSDLYGTGVRLEQERIMWDNVETAVAAKLGLPKDG